MHPRLTDEDVAYVQSAFRPQTEHERARAAAGLAAQPSYILRDGTAMVSAEPDEDLAEASEPQDLRRRFVARVGRRGWPRAGRRSRARGMAERRIRSLPTHTGSRDDPREERAGAGNRSAHRPADARPVLVAGHAAPRRRRVRRTRPAVRIRRRGPLRRSDLAGTPGGRCPRPMAEAVAPDATPRAHLRRGPANTAVGWSGQRL